MDPLSSINFIYGPNGAGKTTVSRLIDDCSRYSPACKVTWYRGTQLETMVYNRDFIITNFNQSSELKGIFTLGQHGIETQNNIKQTNAELDAIVHKIEQLRQTLQGPDGSGGKRRELREIESRFRDECWKVKTKHDEKLQGALTGYRSDKQKFKDRLIVECNKASATPPSVLDLETKAASIFGVTPTIENPLGNLDDKTVLGKKLEKCTFYAAF